jgi:O-antigen ligase
MQIRFKNWWVFFFCLFGVLSLGFMAGMSIGGTLFVLCSIFVLAKNWNAVFSIEFRRIAKDPYLWISLGFFLVCLASLISAHLDPPFAEAAKGFREIKKFHYFFYPILISWAFLFLSDSLDRHPFWKFWGGMAIFSGILACLQFFGSALFPEPWLQNRFFRAIGETGRFHGQGLMFFHLSFASCFTFVAALGLAKSLWWEKTQSGRWFWVAVALAGFFGLFFSYSRTGFLALVAVGVGLCFLKKPLWGLFSSIGFLLLAMVLWFSSPVLQKRFEDNAAGFQHERVLMWESAWAMFKDRPILGFGFGRSGDYTSQYAEKIIGRKPHFSSHPHNNILDALAATGIFGLAAYLLWFGYLFVSSWKSFRFGNYPALAAGAFISLIGFQINGLTQVNFWDGKSQHTLMIFAGLILALEWKRKNQKKNF